MPSVARAPHPLYDLLTYIAPSLIPTPPLFSCFISHWEINKETFCLLVCSRRLLIPPSCELYQSPNHISVLYDNVSINKLKIAVFVMGGELEPC